MWNILTVRLSLKVICLKVKWFNDETEVDIDVRKEASWKRNGPGEKQWGPGLRSECVEDCMGLKDIYEDMKDRM